MGCTASVVAPDPDRKKNGAKSSSAADNNADATSEHSPASASSSKKNGAPVQSSSAAGTNNEAKGDSTTAGEAPVITTTSAQQSTGSKGSAATRDTSNSPSRSGAMSAASSMLDAPFKDPGPEFQEKHNYDSSDTDHNPPKPTMKRGRSKSVAKLMQMSAARAQSLEAADRTVDEELGKADAVVEAQPQTEVRRNRRLSSIYGEFSSQMEDFLAKQSAAASAENAESGSESDNEGLQGLTRAERRDKEAEAQLRRMFRTLDLGGAEEVTFEALAEGFRRMGMRSTQEHLTTMFKLADKDSDGRLNWPEFFQFFRAIASLNTVEAEDADESVVLAKQKKQRVRRAQTMTAKFLRSYSTRSLTGRPKRIKCIAMSPMRPLFAVVDREDTIVYLYDLISGTHVRRLNGHRDSMLGITFSPDRKLVATASRDAQLIMWDCTVGHQVYHATHPGVVTACEFSFDGKYVYSGCQDNLVRKMTASKLRLVRVMNRMPQSQLGVIVALGTQRRQDKMIVISRSCDRCAHVLDASSLNSLATLQGHTSMVWHCGFSPDDTMIFTQCDKMIKVWSTTDFSCVITIEAAQLQTPYKPMGKRSRVWTTASFGPPAFGRLLLAGCNDTGLYFIRLDNGQVVAYLDVKSSVYAMAVGVETSNVLCGDDLGNVFEVLLK